MRRAPALALPLVLVGCSIWIKPKESTLQRVQELQPGVEGLQRLKVRLDIESPWVSGQFDGVVLVKPGPVVRAQFFPDVGGKVIDLLAKPDRVTGYFPMQNEGIDLSLPGEARPHPLLFMALHLMERAAPIAKGRIVGEFPREAVLDVLVRSLVEGAEITLSLSDAANVPNRRRFDWMRGVHWTEYDRGPNEISVEAPRMNLRVKVLERKAVDTVPPSVFELTLPPDARRGDR